MSSGRPPPSCAVKGSSWTRSASPPSSSRSRRRARSRRGARDAVRRTSFAVVFNREDNKTYEATVDLTGGTVVSFEHIAEVTPNFTLDEFHDVDVAMRQHPDVIAKLAARGFTDMSLILIDVWTYGQAVVPERHRQRRLRLPGRGCVPGRDAVRHQGRPVRHPARDLPARGGQRRALEARRRGPQRRGPPAAADGRVVPRDRGQLRVPHLLVATEEEAVFKHYGLTYEPGAGGERRLGRR